MKKLKIMSKNVSAREHGPEEVWVACDGCEFHTQVPRGLGQAFADSLGDSIEFARAQITDHPTGPGATLVLDTRRGDGTHVGPVAADFSEEFETYEQAKGFANYLGFKEATVVRMRDLPTTTKSGRNRRARDGQPYRAMLAASEKI